MISEQRLILLCDLDTQVDKETGDREKIVVNARRIIGKKSLVGVQTQQLAQMQNMNFQYSILIDKMFYRDQKYLFVDGKTYLIRAVTPAQLDKDCKLNIELLNDADIDNAIKEYLNNGI